MARAFRAPGALLDFLGLREGDSPYPLLPGGDFPFLVTRLFAGRMARGDWFDPLLLQVLPRGAEAGAAPGFTADAVGDGAAEVVPGLLRKYRSRALLLASPNCAIHCRYCFRRAFPYADLPKPGAGWEAAWDFLARDPDIDEVILSGGDPLFLDDTRLGRLWDRLLALPRLRVIRIHSRIPVVLPERVDGGLEAILARGRDGSPPPRIMVVVHANHAREIGPEAEAALARLGRAGALLLNQSVLLRGINDTAGAQADLGRRLVDCGVLPYYLHQLDRVEGAAHFEVPEGEGLELLERLREELPGYALPRYVKEIAGQKSKTPVSGRELRGGM